MANIDAPRFEGVIRPYTEADVAKLQGSMKIEYTLANEGAKKLWVCSLHTHDMLGTDLDLDPV